MSGGSTVLARRSLSSRKPPSTFESSNEPHAGRRKFAAVRLAAVNKQSQKLVVPSDDCPNLFP